MVADLDKYSASYAFFEGLYEAGVSHVFVNLGSDHPAIMEALAHGAQVKGVQFPRVITCPHEMVAMSMADGFARVTGKPQCVLVHVDVGTQNLGCAVHNASLGRCPVFIFAGLSPFTQEGELRGSRTEYIHWLQDAPDQRQIVSQFCRYTGEFKTGQNIKQALNRALQFATSDPKGPVYITGAREVMEQEITPYGLNQSAWEPIAPTALASDAVELIVSIMVAAQNPLIIVGYTGRNHATVDELIQLADSIPGVRVLDALGSDVCFPFSHRASLGTKIGVDPSIEEADMILVVDCDVSWIPTRCKPRDDAQIIHIDVDPLKQNIPIYYIPAFRRYRAHSETALRQMNTYISQHMDYSKLPTKEPYISRWAALEKAHSARIHALDALASPPADDTVHPTVHYLVSQLRNRCPGDTVWTVEAVTNAMHVYNQLREDKPGHLIHHGGGGLGWSGGGTRGVKLAQDYIAGGKGNFVCEIVGDGTFLFGCPGTVYWVARRYELPALTIVLSNKGWNAPRNSMQLVHPNGYGAAMTNEDLNISFAPTPDYSGIAKAAAGHEAWAGVAATVRDLNAMLGEAIKAVENGMSAILEVRLDGSW